MTNREQTLRDCHPAPELAFSAAEYKQRLHRLRERMAAAGIDLLFLSAPESMYYLSGYQCEWYQAQSPPQWPATSGIAVHVDHDAFILFDTEREAVLSRYCTVSTDSRIFPPETMRDGIAFIVNELEAERWVPGRVGLEMWSYRPNRIVGERFQASFASAGCDVVDGTFLLREQRWLKSPAEIACIREAGRIADIGLAAARDALAPGVTELEVYGAMVHAMAGAGGENPGITQPVLSGKKSNCPHAMASRKKVEPGDIVLVDVCGVYKRYHANLARTFSMGEPADDVRRVAAKAAGSVAVLHSLLRPGLPVRELNETVMAYYQSQGIWEDRGWIGGYEMGIAFPPDWVGHFVYDPLSEINADSIFQPGVAVNYENQFFLPREVGMYFAIDTLLFAEEDAMLLSDASHAIEVID